MLNLEAMGATRRATNLPPASSFYALDDLFHKEGRNGGGVWSYGQASPKA